MNIKNLPLILLFVTSIAFVSGAGSFFNKDKSSARKYVEDKADYASEMTEAQWYKIKGHVKETYGKLTNDDILKVKGKKDRFYGLMLHKYGYTKNQANDAWRDLKNRFGG